MSETNSYKTVTFTGPQAFAVARALRIRADALEELRGDAFRDGNDEAGAYLNQQITDAFTALFALNNTPLSVAEGRKG